MEPSSLAAATSILLPPSVRALVCEGEKSRVQTAYSPTESRGQSIFCHRRRRVTHVAKRLARILQLDAGKLTKTKISPSKASLPNAGNSNAVQRPIEDTASISAQRRPLTSPASVDRKSKRLREVEDLTLSNPGEPAEKRMRAASPGRASPGTEPGRASPAIEGPGEPDSKDCNPVKYWAENGSWPRQYLEMDPNPNQPSSKKRSHSVSYTQSVKDGNNPKAYTPKYEDVLASAGILLDSHQRQAAVAADSKEMCMEFLNGTYTAPDDSPFHGDRLWTTLDRVRTRNESRVYRDITPSLVPSAELLYIHGQDHLEHLSEELNMNWTKCSTLAGPQPRPDFCVGLMSSAFTEEELLKLQSYTSPNRATMVTDYLYFPFLMCEAKCGEQALTRADRQNAHSSSIAVNALIQLYRASSRVAELDRKILAFSISHDHTMVKIYGHYAVIRDEKTTFHRYPIHTGDLSMLDGSDRWRSYNFTRAVYDKFAPLHLERIRSAVADLPDQPSVSSTPDAEANIDPEWAASQEMGTGLPSSQDADGFAIPALPLSVRVQQENDRLKAQLEILVNTNRLLTQQMLG